MSKDNNLEHEFLDLRPGGHSDQTFLGNLRLAARTRLFLLTGLLAMAAFAALFSIIDKRMTAAVDEFAGAEKMVVLAAAVETGNPVLAIEGDSAFGFSGMEIETICRYNLPICVVVFNNGGIYRGTDVNPSGGSDVATTVFVKDSRYDKMMEAFGGVGVYATTPDELSRAVNEAMDSGKPTLVNAVIDEKAGTESGRIGNLNPLSVVSKK